MTTQPTTLSQPRHPRHRVHLAAVLAIALAAGMLPPAARAQEKPATQQAAASRAALLAEVARALKSRNIAAPNVERIVANLSQLDMSELEALAGFGGAAATGAGRLLEGAGSSVRDRAGEITGRVGSVGGGTSASERGINDALTPGMRDSSGHASDSVGTCAACRAEVGEDEKKDDSGFKFHAGGTSTGMQHQDPQSKAAKESKQGDGSSRFRTADGTWISKYPDGSVRITKNGASEYLSSRQRLVDKSGNAKEPRPDSDRSGGFTYADLKRVSALLGRYSQPAGTDRESSGGPVDTGRTDPTGSRGLYTESRLGEGYVSEADLREIVRLSIEKLRGPQGR